MASEDSEPSSAAIIAAVENISEPMDQAGMEPIEKNGRETTGTPHGTKNVFELGKGADALLNVAGTEPLRPLLAQYIYDRGQAYQRAGDTEKALADFARAVELDPSLVRARINLGQLYAAVRRPEEAIVQYQSAITQDPENAMALISLGFAYIQLQNTEAAISSFERALEVATDEDRAYVAHESLAAIFLDGDLYERAEAHLTKALTLRPEKALSYLQRATVHQGQKQPEEAVADVNRALLFLPRSAIAHNLRGLILLDSGQHKEAVADFDKALAFEPAMKEALYNRGLAYSHLADYPKSIADFDAAIELAQEPMSYTNRGLAYGYLGQFDQALNDHNQALSLDSRSVAAFFNRACMYSLKHEAGSIVEDLATALKLDPSVVDQARSDSDLEWARQSLPEVRMLLSL